jgi:hypothetical protein
MQKLKKIIDKENKGNKANSSRNDSGGEIL